MSATNGTDQHVLAGGEVVNTRRLLEQMLNAQRAGLVNVVTGNFSYREAVLLDSPSTLSKRLLVPRYGAGGLVSLGTTIASVLSANEGALGRIVVNSGASPVILYFAIAGDLGGVGNPPSAQAANRPQMSLATGGIWYGKIGEVTYAGEVNAAATTATSTLTVAEF